MKLSENIRRRAEDAFPALVAECHVQRLNNWQEAAEDVEAEAARAWRSFYIACGVVGLLVAGLLWPRTPVTCPAPQAAPQRSELTDDASLRNFDPFAVRGQWVET